MSACELSAVSGVDRMVELMARSVELGHEQRWSEALACLDEAVAINPRLPICHVNRARVLAELKQYGAALDDCDHFLRHGAALPEVVALREQLFELATASLDRRLAAQPDDLAALLERGNLLMKSGRETQALADYAAIVARDAAHVDALTNLGCIFYAQNRYAESLAVRLAAVAGAPQRADLWCNLGHVRQAQGCFDEARAAYAQALAHDPQLAEAGFESGLCDLAQGNYRAGWQRFEWRWRTRQMQLVERPSRAALWLGGERASGDVDAPGRAADNAALAGKTLLVWAEQGAGDTLQFVRFVPQLRPLAGRVMLRVQAPLRRLIEGLDARIAVVGDDQPTPAHDFQCPLMSLSLALAVDAPAPAGPYLHATQHEVGAWRARLGEPGRLRVGLAWAGLQHGPTNPTRDLPLALLAPFAELDVDFISLQKEVPAADVPAQDALPGLRRFSTELGDYADTAALIMNLDLVIAVDTSVAHLAGALGKPCWLLLRHAAEWRWLRGRSDTPWYPTLTLFRQTTPGDWGEVVARVAGALAQRVAARDGGERRAPTMAP